MNETGTPDHHISQSNDPFPSRGRSSRLKGAGSSFRLDLVLVVSFEISARLAATGEAAREDAGGEDSDSESEAKSDMVGYLD